MPDHPHIGSTFTGDHPVYLPDEHRTSHFYTVGKSGAGKSSLLEDLAVHDITTGKGVTFIDPHGRSAKYLISQIPPERWQDVIFINMEDIEHPIGFGPFFNIPYERHHSVTESIIDVFRHIWKEAWSTTRMELLLTNVVGALIDVANLTDRHAPDATPITFLSINRMLYDAEYKDEIIAQVHDPEIKSFWKDIYGKKWRSGYRNDAETAALNIVKQFAAAPALRHVLGQQENKIDFAEIMDENKILIINLASGFLGERKANMLGSLIVIKIKSTALERISRPPRQNTPHYVYVDEFQKLTTSSFANIFSEARKGNIRLHVAHQYLSQLDEQIRAAVFGNVGTMAFFRVGRRDARLLEEELTDEIERDFHLFELSDHCFTLQRTKRGRDAPYERPLLCWTRTRESEDHAVDTEEQQAAIHSRTLYSTQRWKIEDTLNRSWYGLANPDHDNGQTVNITL